jgi:hypothetical protein
MEIEQQIMRVQWHGYSYILIYIIKTILSVVLKFLQFIVKITGFQTTLSTKRSNDSVARYEFSKFHDSLTCAP